MKTYLTISALSIAVTGCLLSGCMTPQITYTPIRLEANVHGVRVTVTDAQRGTYEVCSPPCVADVRDQFGFMSRYTFTATKPGYAPVIVVVDERHVFDARPPVHVVRFEMVR